MAGKRRALSAQEIAENQRKALKLRQLRKRAQISIEDLAKAMGYSGQSSIQRYLEPDYELGFRPELVARFRRALLGRGDPPITESDLKFFGDVDRTVDNASLVDNYSTWPPERNIVRVLLPLKEGNVSLDMPSILSPGSLEKFKTWLNLMLDLSLERYEAMIEDLKTNATDNEQK